MSISPWIDNYRRSLEIHPRPYREITYDPDDFQDPSYDHRPLTQWRSFDKSFKNIVLNNESMKFYKDKLRVNIDVGQFSPEEIIIKTSGNMLAIEAKHKKNQSDHEFVSKRLIRRYIVPKYYDLGRVESRISRDGILSITAPKVNNDGVGDQRSNEITQTEQPSQAVTQADHGEEEKCLTSKL